MADIPAAADHSGMYSQQLQVLHYVQRSTVQTADGNPVEFDFDLAIACIGMKSENALGKEVLAEFPEAYMIGDAISHQRIGDAVHQGFFTAMRL